MADQARARLRRLWIWFALNLVIFIACYLNYRLQLKHRYLYRTLGVGLCLSRAAAMVINFNLLLVWLPMCKYTLTRLAVLANRSARRHKIRLGQLMEAASNKPGENALETILERSRNCNEQSNKLNSPSMLVRLARKLKQSFGDAIWSVRCALCSLKIKFTGKFLIAVDHCTSLHTICATTITIASVIHTVAHLMNVINFSNKFDPLLGDLNMAEFKGQNPLQLIVSVPGITGCCMVLILFLMSLSSISIIRNSSYDLFQIFHRLSILFVVLLILHPSSHVLKEQSNVERHQPDFCYEKMEQQFSEQSNVTAGRNDSVELRAESERGAEDNVREESAGKAARLQRLQSSQSDSFDGLNEWTRENITLTPIIFGSGVKEYGGNNKTNRANRNDTAKHDRIKREIEDQDNLPIHDGGNSESENGKDSVALDELCLDLKPSFVAQNSICWFVLGAGLSCYLLDLLLRRLRRSRSSIELLDACTDAEGNLIELVLSNNHKRFVHWLPGQFVYLNSPQIATYEWHPFTISSMDNDSRQFTLHIKTGGDWTRKLRYELELRQTCQKLQRQASESLVGDKAKSVSLFCQRQEEALQTYCCAPNTLKTIPGFESIASYEKSFNPGSQPISKPDYSKLVNVIANVEDFDHTTGRPRVECKRVVRLAHEDNAHSLQLAQNHGSMEYANGCTKIDLNHIHSGQQLYSICPTSRAGQTGGPVCIAGRDLAGLDLFIDGPFHSPFERLLEQQVSVCIASGVGWTAFSSIFQKITNNMLRSDDPNENWWWRWRNFRPTRQRSNSNHDRTLVVRTRYLGTRLHLVVIVTTMEQFKPFYNIVKRYFESTRKLGINSGNETIMHDPIQEVTAFITRSAMRDSDVVEFCRKENLSLADQEGQRSLTRHCANTLQINQSFLVRFGRPDFDSYLSSFTNLYADKRKISVYCCGPYQVKRVVKGICKNLNRTRGGGRLQPSFQYHEENF